MRGMVVTAVGAACGERGGASSAPLSTPLLDKLAVLLRRTGRRVLVLDGACPVCPGRPDRSAAHTTARGLPQPDRRRLDGLGLGAQIERAARRYDVVLVDAGACDGGAWRPALIAARLALVPLAAPDADLARHYRLAAHLNTARMFNPGLRVLFVPAAAGGTMADAAAVRAYAAEVMAARVLPDTVDAEALTAPDNTCARAAAGSNVGVDRGRSDRVAEACAPGHAATAAALAALVALIGDITGSRPATDRAAGVRWLRRLALS